MAQLSVRAHPIPSFRRKPESILLSAAKINMGPGFRRDDEGEGFAA
jgi:hypothetical protein